MITAQDDLALLFNGILENDVRIAFGLQAELELRLAEVLRDFDEVCSSLSM